MSIEEKRELLLEVCKKSDCDDCTLTRGEWKKPMGYNNCLDIRESDEEDLDKAIDLVLNSSTDEDIIRRIAELKKSKDLDKAHDTDKLVIPNVLRSKFNLPPIKANDSVNSPSHYTDGKIEVIDYIEDKKLGFCLGNAIKYISRAGKKDKDKEAEDINKAIWYLNRYLKQLEEA